MKQLKQISGALALSISAAFMVAPVANAHAAELNLGVTMNQMTNRQPIHWVSVEQIAASLKGKPAMSVGWFRY